MLSHTPLRSLPCVTSSLAPCITRQIDCSQMAARRLLSFSQFARGGSDSLHLFLLPSLTSTLQQWGQSTRSSLLNLATKSLFTAMSSSHSSASTNHKH
jgi:hypothetical protein